MLITIFKYRQKLLLFLLLIKNGNSIDTIELGQRKVK
jgi:hypothetical protein